MVLFLAGPSKISSAWPIAAKSQFTLEMFTLLCETPDNRPFHLVSDSAYHDTVSLYTMLAHCYALQAVTTIAFLLLLRPQNNNSRNLRQLEIGR